MRYNSTRRALVAGAVLGVALAAAPAWAKASEQQALVDASTKTFNAMMADKDMDWLRQNIRRAKGVIIAPSVVKAGFVFGGSGGNAVFLTRHSKGLTGPAFYKLGTASIGFQAGVSDSQVVTLVMTDKAVQSVLAGNFKVGGDASAAAGPVGAGAKSDVDADFITFSRAKGLYGGINFEGTKIDANQDWNKAYNGAAATAVLTGQAPANPGAANLRAAVTKYAK
jgi:lipid-binding SYLF domain-containing protein